MQAVADLYNLPDEQKPKAKQDVDRLLKTVAIEL